MLRSPVTVTSGRVEQTHPEWHACDIDTVLVELETDRQGLSDAVAAARLAAVGPNRLPAAASVSPLVILGNQLRSVVVGLLIAAAVLSLVIGERLEAAAIAAVLLINAALGFATEWRARRAMEALLHLEASHALLKRNGRLMAAPAEVIVPGDVVQLDAGNRVPADVRLLEATDLSHRRSAAHRRVSAGRQAGRASARGRGGGRPHQHGLSGHDGRQRHCAAVVVATGTQTELGRIGTLVNAITDEPTPLERRLDALGRRLAWLTIATLGRRVRCGRAERRCLVNGPGEQALRSPLPPCPKHCPPSPRSRWRSACAGWRDGTRSCAAFPQSSRWAPPRSSAPTRHGR